MVDAIGREPVHLLDLDLHLRDRRRARRRRRSACADRFRAARARSRSAEAMLALQWKHGDEVRACRDRRGARGRRRDRSPAHRRRRTCARRCRREIRCPAPRAPSSARRRIRRDSSLRSALRLRPHARAVRVTPSARCSKLDELRLPLHLHAERAEVLDEQLLVRVLRIDQRKWERARAAPDVHDRSARRAPAAHPEIHRRHLDAGVHHRACEAELLVELERARLHRERARRRSGLRRLVDDADCDRRTS